MQHSFRLAALAAVSFVVASSNAQRPGQGQWGHMQDGPPSGMDQGQPEEPSGSWASHEGGPPAGPGSEGGFSSSASLSSSALSTSSSVVSSSSSIVSSTTSSAPASSVSGSSAYASSSASISSTPSSSLSSTSTTASSSSSSPLSTSTSIASDSNVSSSVGSVTTSVIFATANVTVTSCTGVDCPSSVTATTSVDFTTADVTVTPSNSAGSVPATSSTAGSGSMTNSVVVSSAFNAAWGAAQSSFDGQASASSAAASTTSSSSSSAAAATSGPSDYGPPDGHPDGPPRGGPNGWEGGVIGSSPYGHGGPPPGIFSQGLPSNFPSGAPSGQQPTYTAEAPGPSSTLTPYEQVGYSTWGTLDQPNSDAWLNGNGGPTYSSAPWGDRTPSNSDATVASDVPVTGVTRVYNFTLTRSRISADGVLRDVILVNDQFPGPLIEANWGDWIRVTVNNQISSPDEGTSMHWHGFLQKLTPWEDGVPSVSQCPIAPGSSLTYNFKADIYGTTWYHSHFSAQMAAGVAGPVIVHGPTQLDYDIDVGPVMLSDWYHIPYFAIVADAVGTNYSVIPPTSDSVLINGRGRFDCNDPSYSSENKWLALDWNSNITWTCTPNAPLSQFRFQSGKVHRLRLINHGANGVQKFSIDGHTLKVIATDLVPVVPYDTDVVTLGVGQRTDILVTATDYPAGAVWMRAELPGGEPCGGSSNPLTLAAIYYEHADTSVAPTTQASFNSTSCLNDELVRTVPEHSITPSTDTWTQDLSLTLELNATGHFEFQINNIAYRADYNHPVLPQVASGNLTTAREWNVYDFGNNVSIVLNITNNMPLTHPFHLHGHNFYVLNFGDNSTKQATSLSALNADSSYNPNAKRAAGPTFSNGAVWDGSVINPSNPMRRDTLLVPSYGFAAIQFELNNPGLWPFHCHIAWHLSAGQVMNILYRPQDMLEIPANYTAESCAAWDIYSHQHGVSQIDSGG